MVLFILILVLGPVSAKGQPDPFQDDASVPWHIVADEVNYDDRAKIYIGIGKVREVGPDAAAAGIRVTETRARPGEGAQETACDMVALRVWGAGLCGKWPGRAGTQVVARAGCRG